MAAKFKGKTPRATGKIWQEAFSLHATFFIYPFGNLATEND